MRAGRGPAALALVGLLAALGVPANAVAIPPPPSDEFYGVTSATKLTPAESARMANGGIATMRIPFYWPHIETQPPAEAPSPPLLPGPGELPVDGEDRSNFGATDKIVERAAREGVRILPFVYGTPSWVADDTERPPLDSPEARAAYTDFLAELVRRYGPGGRFWSDRALTDPDFPTVPITAWQLWNEPNSPVFWKPAPSPEEYAELVELASGAIRSVDPRATIALAGMFGTPTNGIRAWDFLDRFHAAGAEASSFDAYALHPYSPKLKGIKQQARRLTRSIAAGPSPGADLWITEIGWPTDGPSGFPLLKSEKGQKRLLARSYRLLLSKRPSWNVARVIWYVWRDNDVQTGCTVCSFSGLFSERLEAKPAWRKLTQFAGGKP